jgi:hypothetical protein
MDSVAPTIIGPIVVNTMPDQSNKIFLAKAASNICIGVGFIATAALCYQVYQDPSLLNPFSDQRSINPWSDKSGWFTKEHFTCITIALSQIGKGMFDTLTREMEAAQTVRKAKINLTSV